MNYDPFNEEKMLVVLRELRQQHNCSLIMKLSEPTDKMISLNEYDELDNELEVLNFEDNVTYLSGIIVKCKDRSLGKKVKLALADLEVFECKNDKLEKLISEYCTKFFNER